MEKILERAEQILKPGIRAEIPREETALVAIVIGMTAAAAYSAGRDAKIAAFFP